VVPGPADDVQIGVATVNHGAGIASVHSLTTAAGSTLNFTGGSLYLDTASTLNGTFVLSGSILDGPGAVTLSGPFTWSGATIQGTGSVTVKGSLTVNGDNTGETLSTRSLTTAGTSTWSGSGNSITLSYGAVWTNMGTFDAAGNNTMFQSNTTPTFFNEGAFNKTAGTNSTDLQFPFINSGTGTVDVQSGTLNLRGGGASTGSAPDFNADGQGHLAFVSGTFKLGTGTTLGGTGTIDASSATIDVAGTVTDNASMSTLSGGTLTGPGTLTYNNTLSWTGGTMAGIGSTVISATGTLDVQAVTLDTRTLMTAGIVNWTGTNSTIYVLKRAAWTNTNKFNAAGDNSMVSLGAIGSFSNAGTFTKSSSGTGTTSMQLPFTNSGTITVSSGVLSLGGAGGSAGSNTKIITIASGAYLEIPNQLHPYQLKTGTSITGAGIVQLDGGTVDVVGSATTAAKTQFTSGYLSGAGTATFSGELDWSGGTMNGEIMPRKPWTAARSPTRVRPAAPGPAQTTPFRWSTAPFLPMPAS
jgi:hypothetical protein